MVQDAGKKSPTIYDVASAAGVSKSLVSLVIQGDSRVSDSKREAVLRAIEQLQYRPSRTAQLLASKTSKTVGVIITEYKNLSYVSVLRGLREVFDEVGIQVTVSDLHRRSDFAQDPVDSFLSMSVDGLVFICEPDGLHITGLDVPAVLIGDRATTIPGADQVSNDDNSGAHAILNHLYSLGHRSIVHVTGAGGIARARREAYERFMHSKDLRPIVFGDGRPTNEIGGYLSAQELIETGKDFSAVWCANDYMAAGAMSCLMEHELAVPRDVSIAGYDNSPIASDYLLKLTTVDEEGSTVGRKAAEILILRFSETKPSEPKVVNIEPTLVVRETTAKPVR